jgi:hypothetical protein
MRIFRPHFGQSIRTLALMGQKIERHQRAIVAPESQARAAFGN